MSSWRLYCSPYLAVVGNELAPAQLSFSQLSRTPEPIAHCRVDEAFGGSPDDEHHVKNYFQGFDTDLIIFAMSVSMVEGYDKFKLFIKETDSPR